MPRLRAGNDGRVARKPTLEQLDLDAYDDYEIMQSGSRNAGAGAHKQWTDTNLPMMEGLHRGCWCGAEYGHDWPGRSEGAPHPR